MSDGFQDHSGVPDVGCEKMRISQVKHYRFSVAMQPFFPLTSVTQIVGNFGLNFRFLKKLIWAIFSFSLFL